MDELLHQAAMTAWEQHGVLCSPEKHVFRASVATELGVQLNGPDGLIGASSARIFRTILASLALLGRRQAKTKHVQIVLGRWIFILQYRRAAMSTLSRSWDYITGKGARSHAWQLLCREVSTLVFLAPLLQADVRMEFSPLVTCSDASETGGAVASSEVLSPSGQDLLGRVADSTLDPVPSQLLVISLFNGVGGCFRAYDLAGLQPASLISVEIDGAARQVVRATWPHAIEILDVRSVDLAMVERWANMHPRVTSVHLWGGFLCVHLSSARAGRLNLQGEGSNLFFQLVHIIRMVEQVFGPFADVEYVIENVFSMDVSARQEISHYLGIKPLKLDPADCSPMSRPRLAWVSKPVSAGPGITLEDNGDFVTVHMEAVFPPASSWIRPGWTQECPGVIYPTFMKSIPRWEPPVNPAGFRRCSDSTLSRWESDSYRFPPYQYSPEYLLADSSGELRYLGVDERELLMGLLGPKPPVFASVPVNRRHGLLTTGTSATAFLEMAFHSSLSVGLPDNCAVLTFFPHHHRISLIGLGWPPGPLSPLGLRPP